MHAIYFTIFFIKIRLTGINRVYDMWGTCTMHRIMDVLLNRFYSWEFVRYLKQLFEGII